MKKNRADWLIAAIAVALSFGLSAYQATRPGSLLRHARTSSTRGPMRIVTLTLRADEIIATLVEPERHVAVSAYGHAHARRAWLFSGKDTVDRVEDTERILALGPDLVVLATVGDPRGRNRLREAGVRVVDLGPQLGLSTLYDDIAVLGEAVRESERGADLVQMLRRREASAPVPRDTALYVTGIGQAFYTVGAETSVHDMLRLAGLRNLAAEQGLVGFPSVTREWLATQEPTWLVASSATFESLCGSGQLQYLQICDEGRVLSLSEADAEAIGEGIFDAAERLRAHTSDSIARRR